MNQREPLCRGKRRKGLNMHEENGKKTTVAGRVNEKSAARGAGMVQQGTKKVPAGRTDGRFPARGAGNERRAVGGERRGAETERRGAPVTASELSGETLTRQGVMPEAEGDSPSESLIAGRNALREMLKAGRDIDKVFVAKGDRDGGLVRLLQDIAALKVPIIEVERARLELLCGHRNHQGIVGMVAEQNYVSLQEMLDRAAALGEAPLLVVADGIEDPHNLGALIRSAECAGAHGVVIPKRRAVGLTSAVARASAGALAHLPVARVTNLAVALDTLKEQGLWIYAADMDGEPYHRVDLRGPAAIVLGSEGAGISRLVREKCDFSVSIPLYGKINSLNVSSAAAVILCEAARQRKGQ